METRRKFLAMGTIGIAALGWTAGGGPTNSQQVPFPEEKKDPDQPEPNGPSAEKRALDANEKDIKKKVDKLFELASELKEEVTKTDSSKVLSLAMLKKTEEIEKLAHDIRNRARGA